MKISYNFEKDYFKKYNEANGAVYMLKKLEKNHKLRVKTYLNNIFPSALWIFMAGLLIDIIGALTPFTILTSIGGFLMYFSIFLYLVLLVWLFACSKLEINSKSGNVIIDASGITDETSNGNKIFLAYQNLKMVIVTKNLIVMAFNNPFMIMLPNTDKVNILNEIRKYSQVTIIDNN